MVKKIDSAYIFVKCLQSFPSPAWWAWPMLYSRTASSLASWTSTWGWSDAESTFHSAFYFSEVFFFVCFYDASTDCVKIFFRVSLISALPMLWWCAIGKGLCTSPSSLQSSTACLQGKLLGKTVGLSQQGLECDLLRYAVIGSPTEAWVCCGRVPPSAIKLFTFQEWWSVSVLHP